MFINLKNYSLYYFFVFLCLVVEEALVANDQIKKMSLFDFTSNEDSPLELITADGTTLKIKNIFRKFSKRWYF